MKTSFLGTAVLLGVLLLSSNSVAWAQPCLGGTDADPASRALPGYLATWEAKYPTSTLPARMEQTAGSSCFVCHHPPNMLAQGNCYRAALIQLLAQSVPIADAIDQLDSVDSDGDGFTNGYEATLARPEAGEVGYNMGLIGPTGTDPCGSSTTESISGMAETPPAPTPAASAKGLAAYGVGLFVVAGVIGRRLMRQSVAT